MLKTFSALLVSKNITGHQLSVAGLLCRYWNLRILEKTENRDTLDTIKRLQTMIHQHDPTYYFPSQQEELEISVLRNNWKQAKTALKKLQRDSRELRYQTYQDLLESYEYDLKNPESARRARIVKSTIRTEKCREMYRQIRLSVKPLQENAGGIKSILLPVQDDSETLGNQTNSDIYQWFVGSPGRPHQVERCHLSVPP
jgi:hypothetical protein